MEGNANINHWFKKFWCQITGTNALGIYIRIFNTIIRIWVGSSRLTGSGFAPLYFRDNRAHWTQALHRSVLHSQAHERGRGGHEAGRGGSQEAKGRVLAAASMSHFVRPSLIERSKPFIGLTIPLSSWMMKQAEKDKKRNPKVSYHYS